MSPSALEDHSAKNSVKCELKLFKFHVTYIARFHTEPLLVRADGSQKSFDLGDRLGFEPTPARSKPATSLRALHSSINLRSTCNTELSTLDSGVATPYDRPLTYTYKLKES